MRRSPVVCPGPAGPLDQDGASSEGAVTGMWKATIRGLFARKVRLALTALAILLGVSFISATYVLTDTVKQSFEAVFAQTLSGVDLQVQGASALGDVVEPGAHPRRQRSTRCGPSRACARAEGFVKTTLATFVDAEGNDIGGGGPPTDRGVLGHRRAVPADGRPPARRAAGGRDGRGHRGQARVRGRRRGARAAQRRGEEVRDRRPVRVR